jgi:sigma-E factor negative regulatory protein RseB
MSFSLQQSHYTGTVVYAEGSAMRTLHVDHHGPNVETVTNENGDRLQQVDGQHWYGASMALPMSQTAPSSAWGSERLAQHYRFVDRGDETITGRKARRIDVQAVDEHRWGYAVWIDHASYLPLRWDWYNQSGDITRQLRFVELSLEEIKRSKGEGAKVDEAQTVVSRGLGFSLEQGLQATLDINGVQLERTVVSDGLARVSIFQGGPEWLARQTSLSRSIGPVNVHRHANEQHSWLLVGEVPADTLQYLASRLSEQP